MSIKPSFRFAKSPQRQTNKTINKQYRKSLIATVIRSTAIKTKNNMDKRILKKIAERWCKGILLANDLTDEETEKLLSEEEMEYLQNESYKIAEKITKEKHALCLNTLIKEYYDFENVS